MMWMLQASGLDDEHEASAHEQFSNAMLTFHEGASRQFSELEVRSFCGLHQSRYTCSIHAASPCSCSMSYLVGDSWSVLPAPQRGVKLAMIMCQLDRRFKISLHESYG